MSYDYVRTWNENPNRNDLLLNAKGKQILKKKLNKKVK